MFAYHVHVLVSFKYLSNKKIHSLTCNLSWVNRSSNVNLSHNQFTHSINREPPCLQITKCWLFLSRCSDFWCGEWHSDRILLLHEMKSCHLFKQVRSDERLGAKLRVTENRCVLFNSLTYVYLALLPQHWALYAKVDSTPKFIYIYIYIYIIMKSSCH